MAKVNVLVWHLADGKIVAVGRPVGSAKCTALGNDYQSVLEAEIEEEHVARMHETHMVDVGRKGLVKRSDDESG
jgi:hypothetical protein